jgi:hypothetical protein
MTAETYRTCVIVISGTGVSKAAALHNAAKFE